MGRYDSGKIDDKRARKHPLQGRSRGILRSRSKYLPQREEDPLQGRSQMSQRYESKQEALTTLRQDMTTLVEQQAVELQHALNREQQQHEALAEQVRDQVHQIEPLLGQLTGERAALERQLSKEGQEHRDQVDEVRRELAQQQEALEKAEGEVSKFSEGLRESKVHEKGEVSKFSEDLRESEVHHKVERGLNNFFVEMADRVIDWTTKTAVTAIISVATFPILGPVGAATAGLVASTVTTSVQKELRSLSPHLRGNTVNKLVEPLQGKQFDEGDLRKVIGEVMSEDRQANEDLKQFFIELQPTIEKAARSANITITGDVGSLIVGDENTIKQTFSSFLQAERTSLINSGLDTRRRNREAEKATKRTRGAIQRNGERFKINRDY